MQSELPITKRYYIIKTVTFVSACILVVFFLTSNNRHSKENSMYIVQQIGHKGLNSRKQMRPAHHFRYADSTGLLDREQYYPTNSSTNANQTCLLKYGMLPPSDGFFLKTLPPVVFAAQRVLRCTIPKNLVTQTKALRCRMNSDNADVSNKVSENPSQIRNSACRKDIILMTDENRKWIDTIYNSQEWLKFAVIRDPIERFISGFLDRCLRIHGRCYGCGRDIACFARNSYITLISTGLKANLNSNNVIPQLPDYIDHILPQYWHCNFTHYLSDFTQLYYTKTEEFAEEYRQSLIKWGFPSELIISGWGENQTDPYLSLETKHTSPINDSIAYKEFIYSDLPTLNYMFLMYIVDYIQFNLSSPFKHLALVLCPKGPSPSNYALCNADLDDC